MKLSQLKTKEGGTWVSIGEGAEILIDRSNNPQFREALQKMLKPRLHEYRRGLIKLKELEDMNAKAMSKFVILGWKNIEEEDGTQIEYSPERAYEMMTGTPEFKALIEDLAGDFDVFKEILDEETEGN